MVGSIIYVGLVLDEGERFRNEGFSGKNFGICEGGIWCCRICESSLIMVALLGLEGRFGGEYNGDDVCRAIVMGRDNPYLYVPCLLFF